MDSNLAAKKKKKKIAIIEFDATLDPPPRLKCWVPLQTKINFFPRQREFEKKKKSRI